MPRGVYKRKSMTLSQKRKLSLASYDFHNGITRIKEKEEMET